MPATTFRSPKAAGPPSANSSHWRSVNRWSNAEPLCDLFLLQAVGGETANVVSFGACRRLSALVLSVRLRFRHALALTFEHHFALKLRDQSEDVEHESAGRRRRVEVHRQDAQLDALCCERVDDLDQVSNGPRQAIQLGDDDRVAFAGKVDSLGERLTRSDRACLFREDPMGSRAERHDFMRASRRRNLGDEAGRQHLRGPGENMLIILLGLSKIVRRFSGGMRKLSHSWSLLGRSPPN